jgi:hypothetical protein
MMHNTPRPFVGTVVFRLADPPSAEVGEPIERHVGALPGVSSCDFDEAAGLLVVTADAPVERADVLALLDHLGCRTTR